MPGHQQPQYWLCRIIMRPHHFDGLVQDCSISIANALQILQSCTKPPMSALLCPCHWRLPRAAAIKPSSQVCRTPLSSHAINGTTGYDAFREMLRYGWAMCFHIFRGNKYRSVQSYLYTVHFYASLLACTYWIYLSLMLQGNHILENLLVNLHSINAFHKRYELNTLGITESCRHFQMCFLQWNILQFDSALI